MGRSPRSVWSDPWSEKPRRIGTQVGSVWRNQGPSRRHPGNGQRNWKGLERGPRDETQAGTSAFRFIGARSVHDLPRSVSQGAWSGQVDALAERNIAERSATHLEMGTQTRTVAVGSNAGKHPRLKIPKRWLRCGSSRNDPTRRSSGNKHKWKKLGWHSDANSRRRTSIIQGKKIVGHARDRIQRGIHTHQWPQLVVSSTDGVLGKQNGRDWSRQGLPRKAFPLGRHGLRQTRLPRICRARVRMERREPKANKLCPPTRTGRVQPPRHPKRLPIVRGRGDEEEMGRREANELPEQRIPELQCRNRSRRGSRQMVRGSSC